MPTDNKFTKGEWTYSKYGEFSGDYGIYSLGKRGSDIALVRGNGTDEEVLANVKLMTYSKELLEIVIFCKSVILKNGLWDVSDRMAYDKAEAIIYKITEDEL